ncbi:MAG: polysaccharide deacetylase family protein [Pseudobdellovibrionaceae bacterium]
MFAFENSPFVIRRIHSSKKEVFLTFDDGPNAEFTPQVLDLLAELKVFATFFVIGSKVQDNPKIVQRMLAEGHSVLSHSLDHQYSVFFKGEKALQTWIEESISGLKRQTGVLQQAFRPPAGVLTPPLLKVAKKMRVPLVLWNHRFFDTTFTWSTGKAQKSLDRIESGDIILLHDCQKDSRKKKFLQTLRFYIQEIKNKNFQFTILSDSLLKKEIHNVSQPLS